MWIVYQAYLGKAEKYIRTDGNTNFDEGGAFHDIPWVIRQFGIVPNEVLPDLITEQKDIITLNLFRFLKVL